MAYDIRIAGSDVRFACEAGQNILDAALRAGIEMPYSCRKGVCGNCAGRVVSGTVRCAAASEQTPAGKHLLCQCSAESDLEVEPEAWHRLDPSARKTFDVKVFRNAQVAPDIHVLQLRLPAGKRARFRAGQYLQVRLPDGSRRSYSMANPPHQSDMLELHVRHVAGGQFTQLVQHLKSGDMLQVELPYGSFELRQETEAPMLCVVGGTGFAPVKSLLDDMLKKGAQRPVTLVWGGRDRRGLYMMAAVDRWTKSMPAFRFIPALEMPGEAAAAGGFEGRVDDAVRANSATLAGTEVYCCGSPAMVAAVKKTCVEERGLEPHHFFSDVFVPGPAASL